MYGAGISGGELLWYDFELERSQDLDKLEAEYSGNEDEVGLDQEVEMHGSQIVGELHSQLTWKVASTLCEPDLQLDLAIDLDLERDLGLD